MPVPKNRSNSVRKIKRKMPGGKMAVRYRRREKGKAHTCATCRGKLQATHSGAKIKPSLRTPNRMFGGSICGACAKRVIVLRSRLNSGAITLDSVEVKYLPYVKSKA